MHFWLVGPSAYPHAFEKSVDGCHQIIGRLHPGFNPSVDPREATEFVTYTT
jgi:hypothetical protein